MSLVSCQRTVDGGAEESPPEDLGFATEADRVLQTLRTAIADIIASLPEHVAKPGDLQRTLRIDAKLSWKLLKVVNASGSLAAGPFVPGLGAMRTFLKAARMTGIDEGLVRAATQATAQFERLVANHAGNRTGFDSMVSSLAAGEDARQITLQHCRAAFRANAHIYGVQARTQFKCMFAQPASNPRMLDIAGLDGFLSLRQLRPDAPLVVSRTYTTDDDGTVLDLRREPLDPTVDRTHGLDLLREFCTHPLPQFRAVETEPGTVCSVLISNGVGKQAAIDCVKGHVARAAVPRYRDAGNRLGANNAKVRVPCEVLLLDLLVHEDTFGRLAPLAFTCAQHLGEVTAPHSCEEWRRLGPSEPAAYLGKGPSVLYSSDYPRYAELGRYVFERLGWDGNRFDVYRHRIEYPVLPSSVAMAFDLPAAPGGC